MTNELHIYTPANVYNADDMWTVHLWKLHCASDDELFSWTLHRANVDWTACISE